MNCHLTGEYGDCLNAGPKAQRDVSVILDQLGWRRIHVVRPPSKGNAFLRALGFVLWVVKCWFLRFKLPRNAFVFMQYPSAAYSPINAGCLVTERIKKRRNLRLITLVHDVLSFRAKGGLAEESSLSYREIKLFEISDIIIVHNLQMELALSKRGVDSKKLVRLNLFDYVVPSLNFTVPCRTKSNEVVIAGNLYSEKVGYLRGLKDICDVRWKLYGVGFDPNFIQGENVEYVGAFSPDELPMHLSGSFGLVWDGDKLTTCTGVFGEYLRVNNPHKLSLYLLAGMPVIVWAHAAIADFVLKERCGIVVETLEVVPRCISSISDNEYKVLSENARRIGAKVRDGYYLKNVIARCVDRFSGKDVQR